MPNYQFRFTTDREFESSDDASRFMSLALAALAGAIGPGWIGVQMEVCTQPTAWVTPDTSAETKEGGTP